MSRCAEKTHLLYVTICLTQTPNLETLSLRIDRNQIYVERSGMVAAEFSQLFDPRRNMWNIWKHVYICTWMCIYIYIYVCRERERERDRMISNCIGHGRRGAQSASRPLAQYRWSAKQENTPLRFLDMYNMCMCICICICICI